MDFEALKRRLNALNEANQRKGGEQKKKVFWKPTGKHVIRILPDTGNANSPFIDLYFYYEFSEKYKVLASPVSFGKPDPIWEFAKHLQKGGTRDDYRKGKQMEPKARPHVKIIVRGEEEQGPFYWGFSSTVSQDLIKTMLDEDYGDITHPTTGRDITVEFTPAASDGSYSKTAIRPKPNASVVTEDPALLQAIKDMPSIEQVTEVLSYDELKGVLEEYLGIQKDESSSSTESEPGTGVSTLPLPPLKKRWSPPTTVPNMGEVKDPVSAADAFDQLFQGTISK